MCCINLPWTAWLLCSVTTGCKMWSLIPVNLPSPSILSVGPGNFLPNSVLVIYLLQTVSVSGIGSQLMEQRLSEPRSYYTAPQQVLTVITRGYIFFLISPFFSCNLPGRLCQCNCLVNNTVSPRPNTLFR